MAPHRNITAKKQGMAGKWLLLGVGAVVAGVGAGALSMHLKDRAPAVRKPGAALLQTAGEVTVSGKIRPQHITPVMAETDGDLDSFQVEVGQDVFEGQVLARIGASGLETVRATAEAAATTAQDQVTKAESAVANARLEASRAEADQQRARMAVERVQAVWERQQTQYRAGALARQVFDKTQHDYDAAQQDLAVRDKAARASADQLQSVRNALSAAQATLTQRTQELSDAQNNMQSAEVRAPVDGLVVARSGEPGKPAEGELFEIATDMFSLEVVLEPNLQILSRLQPGQDALVLILDLQSAGIPGKVKEIKGNEVVVEFECTLPAVKPGMLADVRFKLQ